MDAFIVIVVAVPFVVFAISTGLCLLLAHRKNLQLGEQVPDSLPYTWGYFLGYSGIVLGILLGATGLATIAADFYPGWSLVALAYAVVFGVASYGVLTRRRWGWVFHIPLSLNPGMWAFNSVYASNRWREF